MLLCKPSFVVYVSVGELHENIYLQVAMANIFFPSVKSITYIRPHFLDVCVKLIQY